jgi:cell division protein FtsQ
MPQSIDKKNKLVLYFLILILLSTIGNKDIIKNENPFLQINKINVSGLSNDENENVAKSLKSFLNENILFVNKSEVYEILSKNNLIELFSVKKKYPSFINVDLKKTDFIAITFQNDINFLVGSNGKLIKYKKIDKRLPFIFGKIDFKNFLNFKNLIDKSNFKFEEIDSLYFFPSNRWDIKTKDGIEIKLPVKDLLKALTIAHNVMNNEQFNINKIIDLRILDNIIISE